MEKKVRRTLKKKKILSNEFTKKVANICGYHQYEVSDVLYALYSAMYDEMCNGNSLEFERMFLLEVKDTKGGLMNREGVWIEAPIRKTVRFKLSRTLENEFRRIAKENAKQKSGQKSTINPNPTEV